MKHLKFLLGGLLCLFLLTLTSVVHANTKEAVTKETVFKNQNAAEVVIATDFIVIEQSDLAVDEVLLTKHFIAPKSTIISFTDKRDFKLSYLVQNKSNIISNSKSSLNHSLKSTSSGGNLSYRLLQVKR